MLLHILMYCYIQLHCLSSSRVTALRRLEERGLVRHKGKYWAINVEAYDAHTANAIGLQAVADQFEDD